MLNWHIMVAMGLDTWVKARRVALGWKQETLGKALGRDQSWVSRIENGLAGSLDVNDVIALGDVLGYPPALCCLPGQRLALFAAPPTR